MCLFFNSVSIIPCINKVELNIEFLYCSTEIINIIVDVTILDIGWNVPLHLHSSDRTKAVLYASLTSDPVELEENFKNAALVL